MRSSTVHGITHIQLTDALMSSIPVAAAQMRLVRASPSAIRAMAAGLISPLSGCSPIAVAAPVRPKWLCAITATSATGSCSGPQHCCCATSPASKKFVNHLNTLVNTMQRLSNQTAFTLFTAELQKKSKPLHRTKSETLKLKMNVLVS